MCFAGSSNQALILQIDPMSINKIIAIAENQIGYREFPANTNKTKYGKWFGLDGVPWCGIFVSWCYAKAGVPLEKIGFTKGFAGCQTAVAYFKKTGQVTKHPRPGDIVFFDWNGDGRYDHVAIVIEVFKEYVATVEGNTSYKNQSNGGIVMERRRPIDDTTLFVHPKVLDK